MISQFPHGMESREINDPSPVEVEEVPMPQEQEDISNGLPRIFFKNLNYLFFYS